MLWALLVLLVLLWCPGPQILWRLAVVFLLLSAIVYVVFIPVAHAQDLAEAPKTPEWVSCLVQRDGMILVTHGDLPLVKLGNGDARKLAEKATLTQTGYRVKAGEVFLQANGRLTFTCTLTDPLPVKKDHDFDVQWSFPNEIYEKMLLDESGAQSQQMYQNTKSDSKLAYGHPGTFTGVF